MNRISQLMLSVGALLFGGAVHAEGGSCPDGYYPIGGQGVQGCAPIPGYGQSTGQASGPQWATRWGATAIDSGAGVVGVAKGMPSKRKAKRAALDDCKSSGGSDCRANFTYYNQCAAMVVGGGRAITNGAATIEEATAMSMRSCSKNADDCSVYYTACSLPQRIR